MAERWSIYGLTDPRTGEVRYIGRTKGPLALRVIGHCSERRSNKAKVAWIAELKALDLRPGIIELAASQTDDDRDASLLEERAIRDARSKGWSLLNSTRIGAGARSGMTRTKHCRYPGCSARRLVCGLCSQHKRLLRRAVAD